MLKAFIFQGKNDTAVVIAETSFDASKILLSKIAEPEDDYYLAGTVMCNEGANVAISSYIQRDYKH
jgi:hypothetical protein